MHVAERLTAAIYISHLNAGGAERVVLNLAGEFPKFDIEPVLVLNSRDGTLFSQVPDHVRVVSLDASRSIAALPRLVAFLRRERPDILFAHMGFNNLIAIWARFLARTETIVIVCQHNTLSQEGRRHAGWQWRTLSVLMRMFLGWADRIVCVSQGVCDDLLPYLGRRAGRAMVLYNPIVTPQLVAQAEAPLSHPWFQPGAAPVFLGVGRLVAQKHFSLLIDAFALLPPDPDVRLVLLGEGPLRTELEKQAKRLGVADRMAILPFDAKPYRYMKRAAALVMSSRYEGFGNVLVEALACGTQIISTDCEFGPSEILANGQWGRLVPVDDAPGMARAMGEALRCAPSPALLRARAQDFSVQTITGLYAALFRSLAVTGTRAGTAVPATANP